MRSRLLDKMGIDGDALGAVVSLVNTDKPVRKLKHVGPEHLLSKTNYRNREAIYLREMMMN